MRISVSTRHGHLAPETQQKISQKLEKLTRFHDRISAADVTIDLKQPGEPSVEVNLSVDGASGFNSRSHGSNLLGAVDGAIDKLEGQLRKHKKKLIDNHRDSARRRPTVVEPYDDNDSGDEDFD